jgi:3'-phosphoadenosine 5'-phosphosulfate (PAPS) 3'-phosphatase
MTEEEMQKKMEFILEQQAQFAVNIDLLRESVSQVSEAQQRTEAHLAEVATAQAQMARSQSHMNEVVAVMAEAQERTDDRLNTLINVVERHISEGHNGKSHG